MRTRRAGGDDGVVRPLEAMGDRYVAGREIDDPSWNEERRNPARPLLLEDDRSFGNALDAADARADHHAGADLIVVALRIPAGIAQRLGCRAHRKRDEVVDLALLLGFHPLVGIIGAVAAVAARNRAGDLGRQVGDLEFFDAPRAALAREQAPPRVLNPAAERRHHSQSRDDHTSHVRLPEARSLAAARQPRLPADGPSASAAATGSRSAPGQRSISSWRSFRGT